VLYVDGVPAGYAELDRRKQEEVELAYFGLVPEFIGRKLGPFLLNWAVDTAWFGKPKRLWVNTNNLDHPKALQIYQKAGFVPYRQETQTIPNPRLVLLSSIEAAR
jgi:GNAT superfamily N-acetyltransferase